MIDTNDLLYPKPTRPFKVHKGLKKKTLLKTHYKPIPKEIKEAVLEQKGRLCFLGFCPMCGGRASVGINDDFHHFPHKSRLVRIALNIFGRHVENVMTIYKLIHGKKE